MEGGRRGGSLQDAAGRERTGGAVDTDTGGSEAAGEDARGGWDWDTVEEEEDDEREEGDAAEEPELEHDVSRSTR